MSRLSKQKGAEFERKICKQLSRWIDSDREDLFWRSAMSGGRATLKSNKGEVKGQAGDITSIDKIGQWFTDRFFVECKAYKKIGLDSFIYSNNGTLAGFVKEANKEAIKYDKAFILIFKENNRPIFVISDGVFPKEIEVNSIHIKDGSKVAKYLLFPFEKLMDIDYKKLKEID